MTQLFKPDLSYPCDREGGRFVELVGEIVEVGEPMDDNLIVRVRTEKGDFSGFYEFPSSWLEHLRTQGPKIGQRATVRVFNVGGGWYPDNRIIRWV